MAEFYIETNEKDTGTHLIHFASCGALPAKQEIRYLGSIASFASAKTEGEKIYRHVGACTACASQYAAA
ncbi:hypothetical protein [Ketobacter sp.]|uniref:hypothetical protein n=1 Tax=Ketobacter sp. TaxID=2083498 RepID=UPI000F163118|nr:hypothetical protein [Ketobacter sp.]RLU02032.1 MAG: hypothetical protein D9N14_00345 [Ketobacter sp.]